MSHSLDLFETYTTAEKGSTLYCHQDFLQKVQDYSRAAVAKRAALLMERLIVDSRREFYKSTSGVNKGWRRSRLGGHGGSHFYAWWAPAGALPLRGDSGFDSVPGALFLRDIRHHDDHSELHAHSYGDYLPLTVRDVRSQEYVPSPLTAAQAHFASSRYPVRVVKGYPGSGKTTALWHAADSHTAEAALYVTYSRDLSGLAKDYFARFASGHKRFHVRMFSSLVRELTGVDCPPASVTQTRERFVKELGSLPPRVLGPWEENRGALYDELHAHLVGDALPAAAGRFAACQAPRVPDRAYREVRRRYIGGAAADAALNVFRTLEKWHEDAVERFFPELVLAWKAVNALREGKAHFPSFDCLALDEAQDLTPIESMVLVELAASRRRATVLIAGDEAQTVRPTDFDWGWFQDLLHARLASPHEFHLPVNLRSPRPIARLVNSVWELYSTIGKQDRPGGAREADIEEETGDQVVLCAATPGPGLEALLRAFAAREGLALVTLDDAPPRYVPEDVRRSVMTVPEVKGLDFRSVCLLDPSRHLQAILSRPSFLDGRGADPLATRLAIDSLRVAVSRPSERIYLLDVDPPTAGATALSRLLDIADVGAEIAAVIPEVVLKSLDEEVLEPEERVQICMADARQLLDVKPEMAWSRARQAVSLLSGVDDADARRTIYLALAEVCFCLALREVKLPAELRAMDLLTQSGIAARRAGRDGLADAIARIKAVHQASGGVQGAMMADAMRAVCRHRDQLAPWFALELAARGQEWLAALESHAAHAELELEENLPLLETAYELYGVADGRERLTRLRREAAARLADSGSAEAALKLLAGDPEAPAALLARCNELAGNYETAAEIYRGMGRLKDTLRNYRSIPDFGKALELMEEIGGEHASAASLEWARQLRRLLEARPQNFARVATEAEKKYVADLLEANMGRPRTVKKPRARRKA